MTYTLYQLVWMYLIYSFAGWCVEVSMAVVGKRKFVNRGFVNSPLCPIYGTGAVVFALFLPELKDNIFFLFLGGAILASFVEYITGSTLERIFDRKWWDYSRNKFNFDGYVCLKYSVIWGIFAVLMLYFINPLVLKLVGLMPHIVGVILAWVFIGFLLIDALGTTLAIRGMQKRMQRVSDITQNLHHMSKLLENSITNYIQARMEKAFPNISREELRLSQKEAAASQVFAYGCSFYKLISLFFIGAFLGDIVETIFCWVTSGVLMSRSSVVYGPFSVVWGIGCMLLTKILYSQKDKDTSALFIAGTILGGSYEYVCSVFTELVFGTVFWDYSKIPFNLGGRINLLYCFFWGIAAVVWMRLVYPKLSGWIEKIPVRTGKIICNILIVFMIFNGLISSLALARYTERNTGNGKEVAAESQFEIFLDERFPDERMERIYPNVKIVNK